MKKLFCVLLVVCLAVTFAGCGKTDKVEEDNRIPVEITKAGFGEIAEHYTVSGVAKALSQAVVTPKTPGKILSVSAELGDTVSAGALLCSLDKSDVQQTVATLNAQLEQANAGIDSAYVSSERAKGSGYEQTIMQAEAAVTQAKNALDQAQINLNLQTTNYQNMKALYESGNISKVNFEAAEAQYNSVVSAYETAQVSYNNAVRSLELAGKTADDNVKTANAGVTNAEAGRKVLQAQLASARKTMAEMDITSPINGVVIAKNANVGEMAAGALYTVADISKINFEITVPESMINQIYAGQMATVTVSAAQKTVDAFVKSVSPGVAGQSAGYTAIVEVDNADSVLKPGMTGSVSFLLNQKEEIIVLPLDTLVTEDENTYVYIEKDGQVVKTAVEIGIKDSEKAEILTGVSEQDRIVSKGQHSVSDGVQVRVVKEY